jgi:Zn-dependent protease with chaperone function
MRSVSWWETHDRARRDSIVLLVVASTICATYLATVLAIVLAALRVGEFGPWRGIETWGHRVGPFGVAVVAVGLVAFLALTISYLSWAALASHVLRRAGARPPRPGEALHAQKLVSNFALGVGLGEPRLSIVDDPAVNALAIGRFRAPQIVLTSGALRLPSEELEALCAHTVAAVAQRTCLLAGAAAAVILDADWCTRVIWGMAGVVFVSALVGVPAEVVALAILGIALLVAATKPLVGIASTAIVRLLDRTAELTDLETVRVTNEPRPLATLMLDVVEHRTPVASTWDIAHLWFDPETTPPTSSWWFPTVRPIAGPDSPRTRAALIDRARVLVDQTGGDPHLEARLEHAARTVGTAD